MAMQRGVRFALLPTLVISSLGGTIPDMGVHTASLYGLLLGLHIVPHRPAGSWLRIPASAAVRRPDIPVYDQQATAMARFRAAEPEGATRI